MNPDTEVCSFDYEFNASEPWVDNDPCIMPPASRREIAAIVGIHDRVLVDRIERAGLCRQHAEFARLVRGEHIVEVRSRQALGYALGMCAVCGTFVNRACDCTTILARRITDIADRQRRDAVDQLRTLQDDFKTVHAARVYVLRSVTDPKVCKIGTGIDPVKRLSHWAKVTGHDMTIVATTPGGRSLEADIHRMFWRDRLDVEWGREFFRWSDRLAELIANTFDEVAGRTGELAAERSAA